MTAPINKSVRVLGPTGANGLLKKVHILSAFTGPTGTFPIWNQLTPVQQAASPTGTFESVVDASGLTGPNGEIKTVIIPGYTGPN
jgi:hypothetical protein